MEKGESRRTMRDDPCLSDVDLNLLAVLNVLLEERSVSRTALRLDRTQSAVSHALGRLRDLLGDPLLVRGPHGMEPSSRALELQRPLAEALMALSGVIRPKGAFDPAVERGTYRVGALDYFSYVLLPRVVRHASQEAPGIDLEVCAAADDAPELLVSGQLELALGMFGDLPPSLHRQKLFTERMVCAVRADHPAVSDSIDLELYVSLPHVLITTGRSTRSLVDVALERMNRERRIAVKIPHFLAAPIVLAGTDYVMTLPERIAHYVQRFVDIKILEPPMELPLSTFYQLWHERCHGAPGHAWLRSLVARAARAL
jgi:DNA-binding transcriptional LysR family regulator